MSDAAVVSVDGDALEGSECPTGDAEGSARSGGVGSVLVELANGVFSPGSVGISVGVAWEAWVFALPPFS